MRQQPAERRKRARSAVFLQPSMREPASHSQAWITRSPQLTAAKRPPQHPRIACPKPSWRLLGDSNSEPEWEKMIGPQMDERGQAGSNGSAALVSRTHFWARPLFSLSPSAQLPIILCHLTLDTFGGVESESPIVQACTNSVACQQALAEHSSVFMQPATRKFPTIPRLYTRSKDDCA